MEGKSVADWIGRRVQVSILRGDESGRIGRFACTLEGVDAYGILVSYEKDAQMRNRFCPWHAVIYVHSAESETVQSPRRTGFSSA
jgi:hypothetical protein